MSNDLHDQILLFFVLFRCINQEKKHGKCVVMMVMVMLIENFTRIVFPFLYDDQDNEGF